MTYNDVFLEYLARLRAEHKAITINWDTTHQWPDGAVKSFLSLGLLIPANAAQSIECTGCEKRCFMDVLKIPHADPALTRAFVVCDDPEIQGQMGRIDVPPYRLQQWQSNVRQLANVITKLLKINHKIELSSDQSFFKLGMLLSPKGRRWVTLNNYDLSLEINRQTVPVEDVLYFDDQELLIDHARIKLLLISEPSEKTKKYTPNTTKRETGKLKTQAMYQDWRDACLKLKKQHPGKSDTWIASQIAKTEIAEGRDAKTIAKNMV